MSEETGVRILSAADIAKALPMAEAVDAMRTVFTQFAEGKTKMPIRSHIDIPERRGTALFMPSYSQEENRICIKTVTLFEENPTQQLPLIQGVVCLFDGNNGSPLAILDAVTLTSLRTGAVCGLATDLLAREDAATAAIFGAGVQGRTQLRAVCAVRPIEKAFIFDADLSRAEAFAAEMSSVLHIDVQPAETPGQALKPADVVCTATVSQTPVFADEDLPVGIHINAIGSYKPHVQEIPAATVIRSKIVVDHRESALAETGDLIIPIQQKLLAESDIYAELGDILTGACPARTAPDEVTFFKSVGLAVQDLAAANAALSRAQAENLGQVVAL